MPLPPPPPPGPPPPPSLPAAVSQRAAKSKGGGDNRNQLLNDIRTGAQLKKAVTNDRSGPVIEGKSKSSSAASGGTMNGAPPGLAGMFAGGMPKLKPGASRGLVPFVPPNRRPPDENLPSPTSNSQSYPSSPRTASRSVIPPGYGTVRRFPNDVIKGMAPLPPPASQKPVLGSSSMGAADFSRMRTGPPLPTKPPNVPSSKPNYPCVARVPPPNKPPPPPKGPAFRNGPPLPNKSLKRPKSISEADIKQNNGTSYRPAVHAKFLHSSPSSNNDHSPSSTSPDIMRSVQNASTPNLLQLSFSMNAQKEAPSRDPPPPPNRTTPYIVRPPASKPPPPPPQRQPFSIPSSPQPQMTNLSQQAPPPPPHKMPPPPMPPLQNKLQVHNPPNSAPPPPPIRNSSTRNGDDFESRWYSKFLSINDLPPPGPFTNCPKMYPSKASGGNRREPAPPVPTDCFRVSGGGGGVPMNTQLQLGPKLWAKATSEC